MRAARLAVAVLLAATLTACGGDGEHDAQVDPSPSGSTTAGTTPDESGEPAGTQTRAAVSNILDWKPVPAGAGTTVRDQAWTLSVDDAGSEAVLDGPKPATVPAGADRRITDTFITDTAAIVVAQDKAETRPNLVTLVDLASGKRSTVTDPAPGAGGPWAAYGDTLAYATWTPGSAYCLATFDLAAAKGEKGYCAPERHGFSNIMVTLSGTSMMTFDARRPVACRTLVDVSGTQASPVADVEKCKGWDVAATDTGHVWSTIPRENRIELGEFHASADGTTYDLGEGTTGSLTWCGDSAYFARDGDSNNRAALLRWTPEATLELVYQSPGKGESFLAAPACAANVLTVAAYGEGGDETVSATVPG